MSNDPKGGNPAASDAVPESEEDGVELRLAPREWLVVLAIVIVFVAGVPPIWQAFERFRPDETYRVPFDLSSDYWIYRRLSESVASWLAWCESPRARRRRFCGGVVSPILKCLRRRSDRTCSLHGSRAW